MNVIPSFFPEKQQQYRVSICTTAAYEFEATKLRLQISANFDAIESRPCLKLKSMNLILELETEN